MIRAIWVQRALTEGLTIRRTLQFVCMAQISWATSAGADNRPAFGYLAGLLARDIERDLQQSHSKIEAWQKFRLAWSDCFAGDADRCDVALSFPYISWRDSTRLKEQRGELLLRRAADQELQIAAVRDFEAANAPSGLSSGIVTGSIDRNTGEDTAVMWIIAGFASVLMLAGAYVAFLRVPRTR